MQYQHNAYTLAVLYVPTLSGRVGGVGTDRPRISMVVAGTNSCDIERIQQSTVPALTGRTRVRRKQDGLPICSAQPKMPIVHFCKKILDGRVPPVQDPFTGCDYRFFRRSKVDTCIYPAPVTIYFPSYLCIRRVACQSVFEN